MVLEIGIYHPGTQLDNPEAYDPRIKYLALPRTININRTDVLLTRYYASPGSSYPNIISMPWIKNDTPLTNIDWIIFKFWDAESKSKNLPQYKYYAFMNHEELFHPSIQASWWHDPSGLSEKTDKNLRTWKTTWTPKQLANTGITVTCIRDWYNAKGYNSIEFFDTFWSRVSNQGVDGHTTGTGPGAYADSKVWAWSVEYGEKLHRAWNIHVHNLGKKSVIVGICGIPNFTFDQLAAGKSGVDSIKNWMYPGKLGDYILQNYDLIFVYQYPEIIESVINGKRPVLQSLNAVKTLRGMTNAKIALIPTVNWWNNVGSSNSTIQKAEIIACAPYVDIIWTPPYADLPTSTGNMATRLIPWIEEINGTIIPCPQSQCTFEINQ